MSLICGEVKVMRPGARQFPPRLKNGAPSEWRAVSTQGERPAGRLGILGNPLAAPGWLPRPMFATNQESFGVLSLSTARAHSRGWKRSACGRSGTMGVVPAMAGDTGNTQLRRRLAGNCCTIPSWSSRAPTQAPGQCGNSRNQALVLKVAARISGGVSSP